MLIRFRLDKNGFVCTDASVVANAPTINYLKCRFDFKKFDAWKDVDAVTAIFKSPTYNVVAEVMLDSYNECYVDPEVYKRGGLIQCKLIGDKYVNGQIISSSHVSEIAEFYINENVIIPTPIPSKYDVFVAELERAEESVENVILELNRKVANGDFDGEDGTSISLVTYNQDGTVTVLLEDGRTFTSATSMKGEKGDQGDAGPGISNIVYGQDGTLTITLEDGTTFTSEYSMKGEKGDQGDTGDRGYTGDRGLSILHVGAMTISSYTDPEIAAIKYRKELSEIMSHALVNEVLVGDTIETAVTIHHVAMGVTTTTTAVMHYHILKVDDTYAYFGAGTSLKGDKGDKGDTGAKGDPGDVSDVQIAGRSIVDSSGVADILNSELGCGYGVDSYASGAIARGASCSGFKLVKGGIIAVLFENGVDSIKSLNINSTGAKYIRYRGTNTTSSSAAGVHIPADQVALFMYDGTRYVLLDWAHSIANTSVAGYMSYSDKNKLNGIEANADVTTVTQTLASGREIGEVNGTKLYAPGIKAIFLSPDTNYTIAPSATERISFTSDEFSQFKYHMLASITFRDANGVSDQLAICGISEIQTGMRITVKNISSDSLTLSFNSKVQVIEM